MRAGVLLSLHILTGNYVNLCFVIVYKLPDAPSLHASELYSRILEHSSSPQGCPAVGKAEPSAWLPTRLVKRAFNHRLQSSLGCITRLSVLLVLALIFFSPATKAISERTHACSASDLRSIPPYFVQVCHN